jgi:hypothetical protein
MSQDPRFVESFSGRLEPQIAQIPQMTSPALSWQNALAPSAACAAHAAAVA